MQPLTPVAAMAVLWVPELLVAAPQVGIQPFPALVGMQTQ
jgi:hypothetical protein